MNAGYVRTRQWRARAKHFLRAILSANPMRSGSSQWEAKG